MRPNIVDMPEAGSQWGAAKGTEPSDAEEGAEPSDVQELVYATATVPVPPIALMAKGISGGVRDNLKVRIL